MKTKCLSSFCVSLTPLAAGLALAVAVPGTASGEVITRVGARASSAFAPDGRFAFNAVNGAGLVGDTHTNTPANQMWLTNNTGPAATFEVDLGAIYNLNSLRIWNYNEITAGLTTRGINVADVEVATAYGSFTVHLDDQAFAQAPGTVSDFSETFGMDGVEARFVRLSIASNHGGGGYTGISEIQFDGVLQPNQILPVPIAAATASSQFAGREAIHAANHNGLFLGTHTVAPTGTMWLTQSGAVNPTITFDLGTMTFLTAMQVWNYNESLPGREDELLGRGVRQADILVSDNGIDFTPVIEDHIFARGPGNENDQYAETLDLGDIGARYVRIAVDSNYGDAFTGLSEVQFFAPTADTDGDGLPDAYEEGLVENLVDLDGTLAGPGPGSATGDFDGDGLADLAEFEMGTNPTLDDTDGDTLDDGDEVAGAGVRPPTNPRIPDTDGDGLGDGVETNTGNFVDATDTGTNPTNRDTDEDGFSDDVEVVQGTDPSDAGDFPLPQLVAYWPFEADTNPQPDFSGFANDAAVVAGATWVNDGLRGGVMEFDGNDCYLEAADSESLSITGDITIAAWVMATDYVTDADAAPFRGIVGKTAGPASNLPAAYDLYLLASDGRPRFLAGSVDAFGAADGLTVPQPGEWHHFAVSRIGNTVSFYFDGVLDGTGTVASPMVDADTTLRIGNRTDLVTDFLGRMDDVAIFAGGLGAPGVQAIMAGDFSLYLGDDQPFAITEAAFDFDLNTVTLTWNSRPGKSYLLFGTASLASPFGELVDGILSQGLVTTIEVDLGTFFPMLPAELYLRIREAN